MLGVDSDNDSAFMSQSVFDYCKGHGLEQTRSREPTRRTTKLGWSRRTVRSYGDWLAMDA